MEEDVIKCPVNMAKNSQPKKVIIKRIINKCQKKKKKRNARKSIKKCIFFSGFREA